ncbi:hypothetical protein BDB01DRAFT_190516 [Pilobolus umbonatus]|nr:hypothetical protein BDB01DRAFT_190516 [Pilobolus umbonatus]
MSIYLALLYSLDSVSMKEVFGAMWKYTIRLDEKSLHSLPSGATKIGFRRTQRKTLRGETQKLRLYLLSGLDTRYHDNAARNIQIVLPQHRARISNLKEDGLSIVGYCRKSDLGKQANSVHLLQRMVNNHCQHSLIDKVFVFPCSNASSPFSKRDLSDQCEVFKLILAIV